jgi:hypothetical protein
MYIGIVFINNFNANLMLRIKIHPYVFVKLTNPARFSDFGALSPFQDPYSPVKITDY